MLVHSSSTCARSIGSRSSATLPARIFDRSSKSLTICSRICAEERIVFVRCDCVADSAVRDSSSVMPTTPFIGVRSSWLMRSRKSLLARAASASCRLLSVSSRVRSCTSASRRSRASHHLANLLPVAADALRDEPSNASAYTRIRGRRSPRRRIAMDRQPQRRRAPDGVRVRGAHLERVIARVEVRERDAALRAEVDPVVGQARHAIREPVVRRRLEVEHAEVERDDRAAVVERDAYRAARTASRRRRARRARRRSSARRAAAARSPTAPRDRRC